MTNVLQRKKLQEFLQSYFRTDATVGTLASTLVSKGTGFMSDVEVVSLKWNDAAYCRPLPSSVVTKTVSTTGVNELAAAVSCDSLSNDDGKSILERMVKLLHEAECRAYGIFRQLPTPPLPVPAIFGLNRKSPAMIVMEDLTKRGAILDDVLGISFEQWRSVVLHMARFHAWSLTTNVDWKSCMNENVIAKKFMIDSSNEFSKQNVRIMREKYAEYFGDLDEKLLEKTTTWEAMSEHEEMYKKVMPEVMTHGDTWINNILFKIDPNAPDAILDEVLAIIDWQTSSIGCGLTDLAHLAAWCVPVQLKRSRTFDILRIYYEELQMNCGSILNGKLILDDVFRLYQHALAVQQVILVPYFEMYKIFAKVDRDGTGQREKQVIEHIRYCYDDAAKYFEYRRKNVIHSL
uniref:CHK kinase-like domain-containing protein n=1 Tax=Romanomermis culicivorax TaxID=13658 RepID=A0A915IA08_ROMCU